MAISVAQETGNTGNFYPPGQAVIVATFPSAVTTGHSVVVTICSLDPPTGVTDSRGNIYTQDRNANNPGRCTSVWRSSNVAGGAAFTVRATFAVPTGAAMGAAEVTAILTPLGSNGQLGQSTAAFSGAVGIPQNEVVYAAAAAMTVVGQSQNYGGFRSNEPVDWVRLNQYLWTDSFELIGTCHHRVYQGQPLSATWTYRTGQVWPWAACISVYYEGVSANFTGTPVTGVSPLTVVFTDASAGSPTAWFWQFGDGQLSVEQHPTVNYTAEGVYTVTLYVSRGLYQNSLSRTGYIVVDGATDPPPPPPGPPGVPMSGQNPSPANLASSMGATMWAVMSQVPRISYPPPPPEDTAAEVEQDILEQGLLDALSQVLTAAQGSADLPTMEGMIRQAAGYLDGLIIATVLKQTDMSDYEMITQGFADQDEPTSSDAGFDGDLWVASPSAFRSRRQRMPADLERTDELLTIWICALDEDGTPVWFQIETYPPGWTALGVTGEF